MRKCQVEGCKHQAKEKVKKGSIRNGVVNDKDFWHCGLHGEGDINRAIGGRSLSIQMKDPFGEVKSLIKMKREQDK